MRSCSRRVRCRRSRDGGGGDAADGRCRRGGESAVGSAGAQRAAIAARVRPSPDLSAVRRFSADTHAGCSRPSRRARPAPEPAEPAAQMEVEPPPQASEPPPADAAPVAPAPTATGRRPASSRGRAASASAQAAAAEAPPVGTDAQQPATTEVTARRGRSGAVVGANTGAEAGRKRAQADADDKSEDRCVRGLDVDIAAPHLCCHVSDTAAARTCSRARRSGRPRAVRVDEERRTSKRK